MKHIIHKIYLNRYFFLFILLFAYVQSIYTRISVRQQINIYIFTPEAAIASLVGAGILFLIILYFIKKWHKLDTFGSQIMLKIFCSSLIVYVVFKQVSGFFIAFIFDKIEQNFNQHALTLSLFSDFLDGLIYGSFFLSYYYYHHNKKHQQKLSVFNKALAESKINQLKAQLNPHFLFNNLNVLDQLIEEDKHKASDFLNEFAEIYRYVLQVTDKELVSIEEELEFAKQYFKLMQHKYGNAYQLHIKTENTSHFIVPLTLQLLIENAIQHNLGTINQPIYINIIISNNIFVSNNINIKRKIKTTSGRALNNLKEQYQLVTTTPIHIEQTDNSFNVNIPIIYQK